MINPIACLRRLEEVLRWLFRYLPLFRPLPDGLEVSARMLGIEIHERAWIFAASRLHPDLSKHTDIYRAHELLPEHVKAVCCKCLVSTRPKIDEQAPGRATLTDVLLQDMRLILERAFTLRAVVLEVEVQRLPQ